MSACRRVGDIPMSRTAQGTVKLCQAEPCAAACAQPPPPTVAEDADEAVGGPFGLRCKKPHHDCGCPPPMVPQCKPQQSLYPAMQPCMAPPQPCVPPPQILVTIPEPMPQPPVPRGVWCHQKRNLVFQWNLSLDDLSKMDSIACADATLNQEAINALGDLRERRVMGSNPQPPAFIVPQKVFVNCVSSTCPIPLIVKAPWLNAENKVVVNNGQSGLLVALPEQTRQYHRGDGKIYELSDSEHAALNGMIPLYGKKQCDFDNEFGTVQGQPDQIIVRKGTTLYQIFDSTMATIDPYRAKACDVGFIVARDQFQETFNRIMEDVSFCSKAAPSTSSIRLTIGPMTSSRSSVDANEPQNVARMIRDSIMGISGGEEDALSFHFTKQSLVTVELSMEYLILK